MRKESDRSGTTSVMRTAENIKCSVHVPPGPCHGPKVYDLQLWRPMQQPSVAEPEVATSDWPLQQAEVSRSIRQTFDWRWLGAESRNDTPKETACT